MSVGKETCLGKETPGTAPQANCSMRNRDVESVQSEHRAGTVARVLTIVKVGLVGWHAFEVSSQPSSQMIRCARSLNHMRFFNRSRTAAVVGNILNSNTLFTNWRWQVGHVTTKRPRLPARSKTVPTCSPRGYPTTCSVRPSESSFQILWCRETSRRRRRLSHNKTVVSGAMPNTSSACQRVVWAKTIWKFSRVAT